jgi:hypothetical protein
LAGCIEQEVRRGAPISEHGGWAAICTQGWPPRDLQHDHRHGDNDDGRDRRKPAESGRGSTLRSPEYRIEARRPCLFGPAQGLKLLS